jgi:hypothetical protein
VIKSIATMIVLFISLNSSLRAAAYEPHVVWANSEVSVCFYRQTSHIYETELRNSERALKKYKIKPGKMSNAEKTKVTQYLKESFSEKSTGIFFTGFKDCKDPVLADVVVMTNSRFDIQFGSKIKSYGRASIGEAGEITHRGRGFFSKKPGFYGTTGEKAYVYLATVDRTTTVHEFGHIAGLRHEHAREEAFKDSNCRKVRGHDHRGDPLKENLYVTSEIPFSYDSFSVMNYCYINPLRAQINSGSKSALSEVDKKTLRLIYK